MDGLGEVGRDGRQIRSLLWGLYRSCETLSDISFCSGIMVVRGNNNRFIESKETIWGKRDTNIPHTYRLQDVLLLVRYRLYVEL